MKKTFKYQSLWLRHLVAIPVLLAVYLIQNWLIHPLSISDTMIISIDIVLVIVCLTIYYKGTESFSWYVKDGTYKVGHEALFFEIKGQIITLRYDEMNEIFMSKNNMFGSYFVLLELKYAGKKLKLYSEPIGKRVEINDTVFMDLFKVTKTKARKLEVVKDYSGNETDYWLKKTIKQS